MRTEPDNALEKEGQIPDFDPVLNNFRGNNDDVNGDNDEPVYGVPF